MKQYFGLAAGLVAGSILGAAGVSVLHAQGKPGAYSVSENEITNMDAYVKEFLPVARKALAEGGTKLAAGGAAKSIEGAAPNSRIVLNAWDSVDQAVAAYKSPGYQNARKIGDKYAKFRIFVVQANQ